MSGQTALPTERSVKVTGTCAWCGGKVNATWVARNPQALFAWHHAVTGKEECAR